MGQTGSTGEELGALERNVNHQGGMGMGLRPPRTWSGVTRRSESTLKELEMVEPPRRNLGWSQEGGTGKV